MTLHMKDAVAQHIHYLRMTGKSYNTVSQATYKFARFEAIMGEGRTLDELKTRQDVMPYIDTLRSEGCQPVTINNYLSALRGLYDWAIAEHLVTHNPFHQLRVKVTERHSTEIPSPRQLSAVIDAIDVPLYRTFLTVQLHTGMRINEVRLLKLDAIDLQERLLYVRESKTGKPRRIPLNDKIHSVLSTYLDEERRPVDSPYVFPSARGALICKTTINRHLTTAATEVLGYPVTSHTLRHAFTTHLYDKGVMETTLSELLGHSEPKTTRRYIRVRENHLRDAVERLTLD
ncbi:tyrosine-type recombinase/integrase [Exiguobacterium profundum]|uniref:tyrosine-type recombinase/integrase n=1 Tax=Exiguobacterium profundum TaxID=307643 RepID=UPI00093B9714|nr:tyrosine-type recombinase/integrase [Exiguobacterium profundum]